MTDRRIKSRHNLIERFRGDKAESLDLDFVYHLEIPLLALSMAKRLGLNPVTVQPDWTTNHHNPTEQSQDCYGQDSIATALYAAALAS
jgi:hypothetical protein